MSFDIWLAPRTVLGCLDLEDHGPKPVSTDGEASNPGPGAFRLHRRGGRSAAARVRRARQPAKNCSLVKDELRILHLNAQSLVDKLVELTGRLRGMCTKPHIICVNETWLHKSIESVPLEGYVVAARRDRSDDPNRGGVLIFVQEGISACAVELEQSIAAERIWLMLHLPNGPLLLCAWYRPGNTGNSHIDSFEVELDRLRPGAIATLVVGDLNIHNASWLGFSSKDTVEGRRLRDICNLAGLTQLVSEPTRKANLLDVALCDVHNAKANVLSNVADHALVEVTVPFPCPQEEFLNRTVWIYANADWDRLQADLEVHDWTGLESMHPDEGALWLQTTILKYMTESIACKEITVRKSSHPWLNNRVERAVQEKAQAAPDERNAATKRCSAVIKEEHERWLARSRAQLANMPSGSKEWWKRSRQVAMQKEQVCSIPALKGSDGQWVTSSQAKADLFAGTFEARYTLPVAEQNEYSDVYAESAYDQLQDAAPNEDDALNVLQSIDAASGTGPDGLSARVLKRCARALSRPFVMLAWAILHHGHWPTLWEEDWIVPIHKKYSQFDPANYRGIHLTAQISKAMERLLGRNWIEQMSCDSRVGRNQFAYRGQRGSRDAIAYLTLKWLDLLRLGNKIAVYLSDVSGAFDKVDSDRLIKKLEHKGLGIKMTKVIRSWLQRRRATVVVSGQKSRSLLLQNQVFQGTVFGPPLWNQFFSDAAVPLKQSGYTEVVYADDLNAFKAFQSKIDNASIDADLRATQRKLHSWGRANQVKFDEGKEGFAILSKRRGHAAGADFRILGITFDKSLTMASAIEELVKDCKWKIRSLLRCQRHFDIAGTVSLFKGRVLPFIEHRTSAIYHAADYLTERVDSIQRHFLDRLGITEREALFDYGLAPLRVRRDIGLLGLIHRTVLGLGVRHFCEFFYLSGAAPPAGNWEKHNRQLHEFRADESPNSMGYFFASGRGEAQKFVTCSALGLVSVYNHLPKSIVEGATTVCQFQSYLQDLVKQRAAAGHDDWQLVLSPRVSWRHHPLVHLLEGR